jgi:hypothetical protein
MSSNDFRAEDLMDFLTYISAEMKFSAISDHLTTILDMNDEVMKLWIDKYVESTYSNSVASPPRLVSYNLTTK